ncbi:MAG TPA: S8 family serine peptidase, partial [Pyrinomonadaceae bacterium]|nr:S8 family serine peptidase [Pyrinomonadaceae bacterium]
SNSSYGHLSGTSMSAPHVSGAAALLAAQYPQLSAASLKATLMNSVDKLPQFEGFNKSGGRLNISTAITSPTVCQFQLSTKNISVPTKGGIFEVDVVAPANCEFTARSNAIWVRVLTRQVLSGNARVTLHIAVNSTTTRSAAVMIGGQEIVVNQYRGRRF